MNQRIAPEKFILGCIEKLSNGEVPPKSGSARILHLKEFIFNKNNAELIPGFENFTPISKGDLLARSSDGEMFSPHDGYIFFPKYGELARLSPEICEIAVEEIFTWP